jgi:hypothetical protein
VIEGAEDDPDDGEPANVELESMLRNARKFANSYRAVEMRKALQKLREARTTWSGDVEIALRGEIDKFLSND